jgi:hypothetical protein
VSKYVNLQHPIYAALPACFTFDGHCNDLMVAVAGKTSVSTENNINSMISWSVTHVAIVIRRYTWLISHYPILMTVNEIEIPCFICKHYEPFACHQVSSQKAKHWAASKTEVRRTAPCRISIVPPRSLRSYASYLFVTEIKASRRKASSVASVRAEHTKSRMPDM